MINQNPSQVVIRITRFNSNGRSGQYIQDFELQQFNILTILDALLFIKSTIDSSLTFRSSCRDGICGSCAVTINGIECLACESLITEFLDESNIIEISPLRGMSVMKDLVVDTTKFWDRFIHIKPWITQQERIEKTENIVSQQQVSILGNAEKCISCGICYSSCPILIKDNEFNGPHAILKAFQKVFDIRDHNPNIHIASLQSIWNCTTCYLCNNRCPIQLDPGTKNVLLRSTLVEKGKIPLTLGNRLSSIYKNNNPYGMRHDARNSWITGSSVVNACEQIVDVCVINCCTSCYDPQMQSAARSLLKLLSMLELSIGNLGDQEKCCGSEVHRLGEIGLFGFIDQDRSNIIQKVKAKQIICSSPHCFDAYKNLYSNSSLPVKHYTQLLAEMIADKKITIKNRLEKRITFHDPCYLGIQNRIFDEPRFILESIPGIELIEMEHNKGNSICCGGGGGNIWHEKKANSRISHLRIEEAFKTSSEFLVTACPFCYIELNDAVKSLNLEGKIQVIDLLQLFLMALE